MNKFEAGNIVKPKTQPYDKSLLLLVADDNSFETEWFLAIVLISIEEAKQNGHESGQIRLWYQEDFELSSWKEVITYAEKLVA
jgi:hypothetical protein